MTPLDILVTGQGARFMGRAFPCSIGRGGIKPPAAKREGDGATPAGTHSLRGMLYNPARMRRPAASAQPVGPADRWSDDVRDPAYNLMVRLPHPFSHERLWRADPLYDLIILTDWNWPQPVPGCGSAIFLHTWRKPRHPTAGCVAFSRADLLWIAARIEARTRLIVRAQA